MRNKISIFGKDKSRTRAIHKDKTRFVQNKINIVYEQLDGKAYSSFHLGLGQKYNKAYFIISTDSNSKCIVYFNNETKQYECIDDGTLSRELIVNNDFSQGDYGWIVGRGTLTVSDGVAKLVESGDDNAYIKSEFLSKLNPALYGKCFKASIELISGQGHMGYLNRTNNFIRQCTGDDSDPCQECLNIGENSWIINNTLSDSENLAGITFYSTYCSDGAYSEFKNASFKEILIPESDFFMTNSGSNYVLLDKMITQDDLDYLNNNLDAIPDLFTGKKEHPQLSFNFTNFQKYFSAVENVDDNKIFELINTKTITIGSYDSACRLENNLGETTLLYERDEVYGYFTGNHTEDSEVFAYGNIDTNFILDINDSWCVEENTDLGLYAFTSEGNVFKDGVLDSTFEVPTSSTLLKLTNKLLNDLQITTRTSTKVWIGIPDKYSNTTFIVDNNNNTIASKGDKIYA